MIWMCMVWNFHQIEREMYADYISSNFKNRHKTQNSQLFLFTFFGFFQIFSFTISYSHGDKYTLVHVWSMDGTKYCMCICVWVSVSVLYIYFLFGYSSFFISLALFVCFVQAINLIFQLVIIFRGVFVWVRNKNCNFVLLFTFKNIFICTHILIYSYFYTHFSFRQRIECFASAQFLYVVDNWLRGQKYHWHLHNILHRNTRHQFIFRTWRKSNISWMAGFIYRTY